MSRPFNARFATWVTAWRWPVLLAALVLVAAAASGARFIEFSPDYRSFFSDDAPELIAIEAMEQTYGRSDGVLFVIAPEDGDALSARALEAAVWLTERAWMTPYATRVDSLTNFQHTTADGDDLTVRDLVEAPVGSDPARLAFVRETALSDPRIAGRLVGREGTASGVNVAVHLPGENANLEAKAVTEFARGLVAEVERRFPGIEVRLTGITAMNHAFTEVAEYDMETFIAASLAVMVLLLAVLTRSVGATFATVLVTVLSVLAAVGLTGWLRMLFTPPMISAPIIVLTVAVACCVHIVMTMLHRMRDGAGKRDAVVESVRVNLLPVSIASLTTALAFLSMNFSESPPYHSLGTLVAFGMAASFLLSVTFLPALLSLLPVRVRRVERRRDAAMEGLAGFVLRRRRAILWGSVLVVAGLAAAVPRNEINDVFLHYLDERVEFRRDAEYAIENLTGLDTIDYSLPAGGPGGIGDPAYLERVAEFAGWYKQQPEILHVSDVTDLLRRLNRTMHGDDPAEERLPDNRELVAQYLLLYELSLPLGHDLNNLIAFDKSASKLTVTVKNLSAKEMEALNRRAERWLADHAPEFASASGVGTTLMLSRVGLRNAHALVTATILALIGISLLLIVVLRSLRLGFVSLVPNLVPAAMGFGIWGLVDGQVGIGLTTVTAMTLGIVVDDTVHFLSRYRHARTALGCDSAEAVRHAFLSVGRALLTTTAVLVAGFAVLGLSEFAINSSMGQLSALIIALALLADFLLLPALLMLADRKKGPVRSAGSTGPPQEPATDAA